MGHRYYDAGTGRFLTRDPLGYGGGINLYGFTGNNPVNEMDPDGLAKVELRFKSENSLTGKGPYHTYIVVTDNDGSEYYFRGENTVHGGLSPGGSGSSASSGSSSQSSASSNSSRSSRAGLGGSSNGSSNSSNSSSAGSSRGGKGKNNGPWGPLSVEYGAYVPGTPDYIDPANDTRPSKVLVNDNLPASYYYYPMKMRADRLNRANIPYNPLSTNSNSAAGYMLGASGFKAPKNCAGWTPGLYHPLPLK